MSEERAPGERETAGCDTAWRDTAWVAVASVLVFLGAHGAALRDRLVANDDVRQQVFWMERWHDPQLFSGDLLADYAQHCVPWGVQAIYRLASLLVAPLSFSKILTGLLFVALAALLFQVGLVLGGRRLGWMTAATCWMMPVILDSLSGGLSRAFVLPLLTLFLLGALRSREQLVAAALWSAALLAPYAFVLGATTWLVGCAWTRGECGVFRRRSVVLAVIGGAAIVLAFSASLTRAGYGPLAGGTRLAAPEFGVEGRYSVLPALSPLPELLTPWISLAPFQEADFIAGALTLVLLGLFLYQAGGAWSTSAPGRGTAWVIGPLCVASVSLYLLARLVALRLFFPSRYLEHTAALLCCLAAATALERTFARSPGGRLRGAVSLALLVLVAAGRLHGVGLSDYRADAPLVARLLRTPKASLVAGHPYRLDNVLAFGERRVVASYELAHPWAQGLWTRLEPRLDQLFLAYYARDPAVVDAFAARYGVDYWLVDERDFQPSFLDEPSALVPVCEALHLPAALEGACSRLRLSLRLEDAGRRRSGCPGPAPFFAPFDERIRRLAAGSGRFALLDERAFPGERIGPGVRLVDVRERRAAIMQAAWNTAGSR